MEVVVILAVALFAIGFPGTSAIHPGAVAMFTGESVDGLECRPTAEPDSVLEKKAPSRSTNFSLRGSYTCYRPVFSSEERDPFIDQILSIESMKAKRVAIEVASRLQGSKRGLIVTVVGAREASLDDHLSALYRNELAAVLGPGRVLHSTTVASTELGADDVAWLEIRIRRIDAPDLMTRARFSLKETREERSWQDL